MNAASGARKENLRNDAMKKKEELEIHKKIQQFKEESYIRLKLALECPLTPYTGESAEIDKKKGGKPVKENYFEDLIERPNSKPKQINYQQLQLDFATFVNEQKTEEIMDTADGEAARKHREATRGLPQESGLPEELEKFLLRREEVAHNVSMIKKLLRKRRLPTTSA